LPASAKINPIISFISFKFIFKTLVILAFGFPITGK
jgi:hypothetical protein